MNQFEKDNNLPFGFFKQPREYSEDASIEQNYYTLHCIVERLTRWKKKLMSKIYLHLHFFISDFEWRATYKY